MSIVCSFPACVCEYSTAPAGIQAGAASGYWLFGVLVGAIVLWVIALLPIVSGFVAVSDLVMPPAGAMVLAGAIELVAAIVPAGAIVLAGAIELAAAMLLDCAPAAPAESKPRLRAAANKIRDIALISDVVLRRRSAGADGNIGKTGGGGQCRLGMDSMPGRQRMEGAISNRRNGA